MIQQLRVNQWDSLCFVVAVIYQYYVLFIKNIGNKLSEHKINIIFLVKLEEMLLTLTTCYSKFMERE
jgi:hypothetical protein